VAADWAAVSTVVVLLTRPGMPELSREQVLDGSDPDAVIGAFELLTGAFLAALGDQASDTALRAVGLVAAAQDARHAGTSTRGN
jgi:hypothetical protein